MSKGTWLSVAGLLVILVIVIGVVARSRLPGSQVHSDVPRSGTRLQVTGVSAQRSNPASSKRDGKALVVTLGDKSARVTAEQVDLPGGRVVSIPPNARVLELHETKDGMRVLVDGNEVR